MTVSEKDEWAEKEALSLFEEITRPCGLDGPDLPVVAIKATLLEAADRARKEDEALLRGALEALEMADEKLVEFCDAQDSPRLFFAVHHAKKNIQSRLGGRS